MQQSSMLESNNQPSAVENSRQPRGLYVLFFTEMWERFGYMAVQMLLVLYLIKKFHYADTHAYTLLATFDVLLFTTPVIGGYLADRYLGFRKAIFIGGGLLTLGYFGLALHGYGHILPLSLACLAAGNGLFKGNVSSLLGTLYLANDFRRDSGFTLFYMGINLGTFISSLICGYVAIKIGWGYGFGLAGVGMLIGILTFALGQTRLKGKGLPPEPSELASPRFLFLGVKHFIYIGITVAIFIIALLIEHSAIVDWGLVIFSMLTLIYVISLALQQPKQQRNKLFVLLLLMLFSIVFWAIYQQMFLSSTLFINREVNRHVFDWLIPTPMFTALNPFLIIIFAPLLAVLWMKLSKHKRNISIAGKFALAMLMIGLGYYLLAYGISSAANKAAVAVYWVFICYFLQTIGELFLSPIGLSAVTSLTPPRFVGMMMGVWFLSFAASNALAGKLANLANIPKTETDPVLLASTYHHVFTIFGYLGIGIGICLLLLTPLLKKITDKQNT